MDFFTTHAAPLAVNIDGVSYQVPRFLNPALKAWAAIVRKQIEDEATADMGPDDKARFLLGFHPRVDIADALARTTTPEGAEYVVKTQLALAKVPEDVVARLLETVDPMLVRRLSDELTNVDKTLAKLGVTEVENENPTPPSPGESGDSQGTGTASTPGSDQSTT